MNLQKEAEEPTELMNLKKRKTDLNSPNTFKKDKKKMAKSMNPKQQKTIHFFRCRI